MATTRLALFDRLIMTGLLLALITGGCINMAEIKETKEELKKKLPKRFTNFRQRGLGL